MFTTVFVVINIHLFLFFIFRIWCGVRLPDVRELEADEAAESGPGHGSRQPGLGQQPGEQVHVIRMLVDLLQPEQQNSIKDDI